jgi:hypothetical protein
MDHPAPLIKRFFGFGTVLPPKPPPNDAWKNTPPSKASDLFPVDAFPFWNNRVTPSGTSKTTNSVSSVVISSRTKTRAVKATATWDMDGDGDIDADDAFLDEDTDDTTSEDDSDDDGDDETPPPQGPVGGLAAGMGLTDEQGGTVVSGAKTKTGGSATFSINGGPAVSTTDMILIVGGYTASVSNPFQVLSLTSSSRSRLFSSTLLHSTSSVFSSLAAILILVLIGLLIHFCVKQRRLRRKQAKSQKSGSLVSLVPETVKGNGKQSKDMEENVFLDVRRD